MTVGGGIAFAFKPGLRLRQGPPSGMALLMVADVVRFPHVTHAGLAARDPTCRLRMALRVAPGMAQGMTWAFGVAAGMARGAAPRMAPRILCKIVEDGAQDRAWEDV